MLNINFSPFPILTSSKIKLRQITENDADKIFELRSNSQIMQFILRPLAKTKQDAFDLIALMNNKVMSNTGINWSITLPDSDDLIGIIGHYKIDNENFRSELGYILNPDFHNQGIITDAIKLILHYGFTTLQLHSVEAIIDPGNFASEKVLIKNGFVKEAHLTENCFFEGKFLDTVIYSLLKKTYLS